MPRIILGTEAAPRFIATRADWGARSPTFITTFPAANKPTTVNYEHHTVTAFFDAGAVGHQAWDKVVETIFSGNESADAVMRQVQNFHMDTRHWSDIAYTHLVSDDGGAYEGRGWNRTGGHTAGANSTSFAVCHIGDYTGIRASDAALDTAAALWQEGIALGAVSPTFTLRGHREAPGAFTACPGNALFAQLPDLRSRVGHLPAPVPTPPPSEEDDMDFVSAIANLYRLHLGREPDREGLNSWCLDYWTRVSSGNSPTDALIAIEVFFSTLPAGS